MLSKSAELAVAVILCGCRFDSADSPITQRMVCAVAELLQLSSLHIQQGTLGDVDISYWSSLRGLQELTLLPAEHGGLQDKQASIEQAIHSYPKPIPACNIGISCAGGPCGLQDINYDSASSVASQSSASMRLSAPTASGWFHCTSTGPGVK